MKSKTRLVSVRLSQDEYDLLKSMSAQQASGSISGLIRASMHGIILHGSRTLIELLSESPSGSPGLVRQQVDAIQLLERKIESLDDEMRQIRGGGKTAESSTGPDKPRDPDTPKGGGLAC